MKYPAVCQTVILTRNRFDELTKIRDVNALNTFLVDNRIEFEETYNEYNEQIKFDHKKPFRLLVIS